MLSVPFAIEINILLVYLAAFAIATVTLLFRPAKTAVVPQIVGEGDLVTANSAISVAETAADLFGLPLAAVIVASLSGIIEAAFVLDSATYLVSAILIGLMVVARQEETLTPFSVRAIWSEMAEGWNFLHRQAELFANTVITTLAQIAFGAEIVLAILYAEKVLDTSRIGYPQNYGLLLAAVGLGSVVGGVAMGWIGDRLPKGPLTIAGLVGMGVCLVAVGFVQDPYVAIGLFFLTGATNMLFLIPTITLFQQRTPQRLMGRVVSSRQALVFGVMAASMAVSGWLAGIIGPAPVLAIGGAICALAGLSGWPCRPCARLAERSGTLRRAVGVFDVAVVVLAVGVCGSLGLLAWTLGVGSEATIARARREVNAARARSLTLRREWLRDPLRSTAALARVQGDR